MGCCCIFLMIFDLGLAGLNLLIWVVSCAIYWRVCGTIYIKERELELIKNQVAKKAGRPHELYDSPCIKQGDIENALSTRKAVMICVVSTDPSSALIRAYRRGEKENRYCPGDEILKSHKDSAMGLSHILKLDALRNSNTTVLMYDNNGDAPYLFAIIDFKASILHVRNPEMLRAWIKKCNMETSIEQHESIEGVLNIELFKPGVEPTFEEYFPPHLKIVIDDESLNPAPSF